MSKLADDERQILEDVLGKPKPPKKPINGERLATWMFMSLLWLACAGGLVVLGYVVVKVIKSEHAIDYCYVEVYKETKEEIAPAGGCNAKNTVITGVMLTGHRPWTSDASMGIFPDFLQAAAAAEKMRCPLRVVP